MADAMLNIGIKLEVYEGKEVMKEKKHAAIHVWCYMFNNFECSK